MSTNSPIDGGRPQPGEPEETSTASPADQPAGQPADQETGQHPQPAIPRDVRRWNEYPMPGVLGALVGILLSLTPSLLPRGGFTQGLVTGVALAVGYGVGVLIAWLFRQFTDWRAGPRTKRVLRWFAVPLAVLLVPMLWWGYTLQNDLFELMGVSPSTWQWFPIAIIVALIVGLLLIWVARLVRFTARAVARLLHRIVPLRTARALGVIIAGALLIMAVDGVLFRSALSVAESLFRASNADTSPGVSNQESRFTSGGPRSASSWESLGRKGRDFVAGQSTVEAMEDFSGDKAVEPIRIYAGLDSGDADERAALVMDDLNRMGAFDRELLAVGTTTGTGWVDEQAVDPLEYMYDGDTAIVATQYSYLPSWLSFLVDQDRAKEAAVTLFDAVYAQWETMPRQDRPTLVVFGESLGSFGAEAAFSGLPDIVNRTDAALFVGPPNSNELWTKYVEDRDPGSPEVLPVYQDGRTLRFAGLPVDLDEPATKWERPRVLYLQHASDPIVWWSPDLMLSEPDWLREPPGRDVLPELRYFPFLTFLQVSADMMASTGFPTGHGHWYGEHQTNAWAALVPPDGWTQQRTDDLQQVMRALNPH